jgi:hypothetical protein
MRNGGVACLATVVMAGVVAARGAPQPRAVAAWHVGPTGTATAAGTATAPWSLVHALAGAAGRIRPGDTVWIHGGRYTGSFATALEARADTPIVFRAGRGERVTIDGTLRADGAHLVFWGFEIMQSDPVRFDNYALQARTRRGKFINLVIHDAGSMGVSFWTPAENAELYGCIVYNNGTHENLDHGVYVHNERGEKDITDNVFFNNLAYGIHMYAGSTNPPQRDVRISGNIAFNNGTIAAAYRAKGNVIVGGQVPMSGMHVTGNVLFYSGGSGENLRMGYGALRNGGGTVRRNALWGGERALRYESWPTVTVERNVLGGTSGPAVLGPALDGSNTLYAAGATPPVPTIVVRPNRYERGRAFVAIVNHRRAGTVKVSLAGVLSAGQAFEIHNVQDLFGPPVVSGTFAGDSVAIPMGGVTPPVPLGRPAANPPRTGPAFDTFLVTVQP